MRLYRFADDVAIGGRLWVSTVEYARELAEAGCRRAASGTSPSPGGPPGPSMVSVGGRMGRAGWSGFRTVTLSE